MLTLDPHDRNNILYKGKSVARLSTIGDRTVVEIKLGYEASSEDWIVPLSYLARGLAKLEPPPPPIAAELQLGEDSIEPPGLTRVMLLEKELKAGGYNWVFHKSDPDPWPSPVHGHDYERGLVLDAATGQIFETTNRSEVGNLRKKDLLSLQKTLKQNKDLKGAANRYLP
jgi:hypothetical protein